MKLFWTRTARQDLIDIQTYIALDNPGAAAKWINRLKSRARNIVYAPFAGRKVPEFSRDDIREILEKNYRIVYQVLEGRIIILTVFEGHRLLPEMPL